MCKTVNLPEGPSERLLLNASFLPQLLRVDGSKGHPKTREFLEVGRRDSGSIPQPGFLFRSMLTCARTCVFTVRRAPVTITNQARMPMKPLTGGRGIITPRFIPEASQTGRAGRQQQRLLHLLRKGGREQ